MEIIKDLILPIDVEAGDALGLYVDVVRGWDAVVGLCYVARDGTYIWEKEGTDLLGSPHTPTDK